MKTVIGITAHVDAGKTTLSESLLYLSGAIRNQGRVDHKDSFLDYNKQERERGITIFSKISSIHYNKKDLTFIDTPGHIDFSGEMERALTILDYALLIINGCDGIQSHTKTIFRLLKHYHIPTFLFVNKMDISYLTQEQLLKDLNELSDHIVLLSEINDEELAMKSDTLLEEYLNYNKISHKSLQKAIKEREIFPVYFGSALKNINIKEMLDSITDLIIESPLNNKLKGIVYKILYENNERLTFIKITGGQIHVKEEINGEKINQIRAYQGEKYSLLKQAKQGDIVALTGIKSLKSGDMIGYSSSLMTSIFPVMHYDLHIEDNEQSALMMENLKKLGEEEPLLQLKIRDINHIEVSLMGEVQIEILKQLIKERYHQNISIDHQQISYKETIKYPVEGVGHFEPLRHYAEVHVLLEPLPSGSGLQFENKCMNDLQENYQNLIMTHLKEKTHLGILTGSPITDIKITLLGGASHLKHTEGGDFRQAVYRAVRQGLMMSESILLEPSYHYEITIPSKYISKIFYDFQNYNTPIIKEDNGQNALLYGDAPVLFLSGYNQELMNSTKGNCHLSLLNVFYTPVNNQEEIIKQMNYHPLEDLDNPSGSIFCTHGSGYYVEYDHVSSKMHLPYFSKEKEITHYTYKPIHISDEEVKRVYENTYGKQNIRLNKDIYGIHHKTKANTVTQKKEYLIVDGYNMIFSWDELKDLSQTSLALARDKLINILSNYQGYKKCLLLIVFDGYKVKDNIGEEINYHNIHIVYTKEAQTADAYIESITKTMTDEYRVTVASSDYMEQSMILGHGALRISARELMLEIESLNKKEKEEYLGKQTVFLNTPLEDLINH
ncbi:NYN domain-containing protein [Eggerthia catenaformis]|uniref:NYN domain-containing protein n=1 Tax=Eggerthia catenaformis TaxID=31973 RepID=UPI003C6FC2D5